MDMDFKSNPFIWIWIGSRLDFEKSNPWPPLLTDDAANSYMAGFKDDVA